MSISRRKFLRGASALTASIAFLFRSGVAKSNTTLELLGHRLHNDSSRSLVELYARSLALTDEDARWKAQEMFHAAQLSRWRGGTMGHKLGSLHRSFLEKQEYRIYAMFLELSGR